MFAYVVSLALGAVAFLLVARLLPGFEIRGGFRSAFVVALVYGILKMLLQKVLIVVTLPMVVLSLGLFGTLERTGEVFRTINNKHGRAGGDCVSNCKRGAHEPVEDYQTLIGSTQKVAKWLAER